MSVVPIKPLELVRQEGSFDQFIGVWDKFVPKSICQKVIEDYESTLERISSNTFENTNIEPMHGNAQFENRKLGRSDISLMMNQYNPNLAGQLSQYLQACFNHYIDEYPQLASEIIFSSDIKIQKTGPGGGYHVWHCENSSYAYASRTLVWAIYLNDIKEGGETEFLYQHKRVIPKAGTTTIWPAAFTHVHRGNPPLANDKYILTGWYLTAPRLSRSV